MFGTFRENIDIMVTASTPLLSSRENVFLGICVVNPTVQLISVIDRRACFEDQQWRTLCVTPDFAGL